MTYRAVRPEHKDPNNLLRRETEVKGDMHLLRSGENGPGTGVKVKGGSLRGRASYCGLEENYGGGTMQKGKWKASYNVAIVTCERCLEVREDEEK